MLASTRSRALRAALTVTLSPALGCGGNVASDDLDAALHEDVHVAVPDDAGARATTRADARVPDATRVEDAVATSPCPGVASSLTSTVSASTFACCAEYLEAALGDAGTVPAGPGSTACCTSVISYVDHGGFQALFEAGAMAQTAVDSCCGLLATDGGGPPEGAACTPWGPPVPPVMPASLRLEVA